MIEDKLIETILEIGVLIRSIDDLELDDDDKYKIDLIEKMCEDIEVAWKVEQATNKLQLEMRGL